MKTCFIPPVLYICKEVNKKTYYFYLSLTCPYNIIIIIIIIIIITCKEWTKKGSLEEFYNSGHLEDKERENLVIRG